MACHSTVCVNNDLSSSQAGITHRSANNKATSWVNKNLHIRLRKINLRKYGFDDVFNNLRGQLLCYIYIFCVLTRDNNRIKGNRFIAVIFNSYLCLSIWTKVCQSTALTYGGELLRELVSEVDWKRHEFFCVIACVTKHQTLIASTLKVKWIYS